MDRTLPNPLDRPDVCQQLLERAPDAMLAVDGSGTIRWANHRMEEVFGYGAGELSGQPVEVLVPEEHRMRPRHQRHGQGRSPRQGIVGLGPQLVARRRDGTTFPAEITLSSIDTPTGQFFTAALRDVTDRSRLAEELEWSRAEQRRLEAQVQQAMQLESLGQLAGGVAHDFNNLLAVILNHTDFALAGLESALGHALDSVRDDLRAVMRACDSATSLVRQLLIFARRNPSRPERINLNAIVARVESLLRRTLGEDITLDLRPHPGLLAVEADPTNLEQVLVNLAVNARDAMPSGGCLTVRTENVIDLSDAGTRQSFVRLTVTDTGVGMTPDVVSRAFDPFFTTKDQHHGTGLGLATVYGVVTRAGGRITIESEPGAGTSVTVLLPAADLSGSATNPNGVDRCDTDGNADCEPAPFGGRTILLAEDNADVRSLADRILTGAGYDVLVACDAGSAIDLMEQDPDGVDLLLTDVVMPRVSGTDLADALRRLRPDLPVLFMSGYPEDHLARRHGPGLPVRLLHKPFTAGSMLEAVAGALAAPLSKPNPATKQR